MTVEEPGARIICAEAEGDVVRTAANANDVAARKGSRSCRSNYLMYGQCRNYAAKRVHIQFYT